MKFRNALPGLILVFGTMLSVAGCGKSAIDRFAPVDRVNDAKEHVQLLRSGHLEAIKSQLDESIPSSSIDSDLSKLQSFFPEGVPSEIDTVFYFYRIGGGDRVDTVQLQYHIQNRWVLVDYRTLERDGKKTITRFYATPLKASLEELNRFNAPKKSLTAWFFLLMCLISLGISLTAFALCVRTSYLRRKWLWAIVTLLGVVEIGLNWTTGESEFRLLSIHIPTATWASGYYTPWYFYCYLPIGAILFVILRPRLERHTIQPPSIELSPVQADINPVSASEHFHES